MIAQLWGRFADGGAMGVSEPRATQPTTMRSRRIAKRLAFVADDLRSHDHGDVVLAYHRVGGRTASPVDLPVVMFERQMAHLRALGSIATLDDIVANGNRSSTLADTLEPPAASSIVVTFDDGTADFVDVALPILVRYQIPATLYLATEFVDSQRNYPADGKPISWNGLREALSTGLVTVGAHTHTHRLLDRCSLSEATSEIDSCIDRIGTELGVTAEHFAYPKACPPRAGEVDELIRSRFRSAAVGGTRPNVREKTDWWHLYRSPIQNADGWQGFVRKSRGGMASEDDLRRVINLVRYRGRTS